jgi:hypothetical protein
MWFALIKLRYACYSSAVVLLCTVVHTCLALQFEVPFRFVISTTAIMHGLGCWFDLSFQGSKSHIILSTGPVCITIIAILYALSYCCSIMHIAFVNYYIHCIILYM